MLALALVLFSIATVSPQRIAVSIQTYNGNHHMVESSRDSWRKGISTMVLTNGTAERMIESPSEHEVWFEAPDLPKIGWNNPRCALSCFALHCGRFLTRVNCDTQ
jgi:hypothetical protein